MASLSSLPLPRHATHGGRITEILLDDVLLGIVEGYIWYMLLPYIPITVVLHNWVSIYPL